MSLDDDTAAQALALALDSGSGLPAPLRGDAAMCAAWLEHRRLQVYIGAIVREDRAATTAQVLALIHGHRHTQRRRVVSTVRARLRTRATRHRWGWAGVAAAAALVLAAGMAAGMVALRHQPAALVETGPVLVSGLLERAGQPQRVAAPLPLGATLVVPTGPTLVRWSDGSEVVLASGTALRLRGAGPQLELQAGELEAEIAKQPSDRPAVMTTPAATATVVGTHFRLSATAQQTRLAVTHGRIRFANERGQVMVDAAANAIATTSTAPVLLTPDPVAAVARPALPDPLLIDDHQGALAWAVNQSSGPSRVTVTPRVAGGRAGRLALRVDLGPRTAAQPQEYNWIGHPLRDVPPAATGIDLWLRAEQAAAATDACTITLRERDGDIWQLAWFTLQDTGPEWHRLRLSLSERKRLSDSTGDGAFSLADVAVLTLAIGGDQPAVLYIGDVSWVVAGQP